MNSFQLALVRKNTGRPPVWFMRQAGRYHSHYQKLKEKNSFIELCKNPVLACETTMGPMRDFNFDAAILFSDLLFPLEVLGMGLVYDPGPKLSWHYETRSDESKFTKQTSSELVQQLSFQKKALELIRIQLNKEFEKNSKGLIGFVGGPLTLYTYATTGGHAGDLSIAEKGFEDGRFDNFMSRLIPLMVENMYIQAEAKPDAIAIFDTSAGEFKNKLHLEKSYTALKKMIETFKLKYPNMPIIYYSRGTSFEYWDQIIKLPIACLGVDWRTDLIKVIEKYSDRVAIQGNFDPEEFMKDENSFMKSLEDYFSRISKLPKEKLQGWVCGLGHGILQKTPEKYVKYFLEKQKEVFNYEITTN